MDELFFGGFNLYAWITIVTVLVMFTVLLFTKIRADVVFLGALGILLGSLPIHIPGMPQAVKLGLAGGPLIVAILLSYFGHRIGFETYTTQSANLMLREMGLCLFLAAVGLGAGENFAQTLSVFPGLSRMGIVLSAAFLRGANYSGAVEQAGLMGIPASAAAAIYLGISAKKLGPVSVSTGQCAAGFLLTAVVGMITLRVLTDRAAYRKPTGFAYWCWGAALTALVLFLAAA